MSYCIGVDLGGTNIAAGIVDLKEKRIIRKSRIKTRAPRPCEEISEDIFELCKKLVSFEGMSLKDMQWIGIATPGIVKDGKVIYANNLGWQNAEFVKIMHEKTGRPVIIANDANTAAYAEAIWGVGAESRTLVAVTLGTGVGGGIVIDGRIWEGMNGFAAELGHITLDSEGRICSCGKRGCFEAYCSATALVSEARRVMHLYPGSVMWDMCGRDASKMNGYIPFKAYEQGDEAATEVIEDFIKYLAIGISNIINILQPDVLCIGGGISAEGELLMAPLRKQIERISFGVKEGRTKVAAAKFLNDAGIIGAALLGKQEEITKVKEYIKTIIDNFDIDGVVIESHPYGNGHINDTRYILVKNGGEDKEYILQKINKNVFKSPPALMENYTGVTKFLRDKIIKAGGDPDRETLNVIKTKAGENYYLDENGDYWRLILFVKDSKSYDLVERPEQFYDSAVAFGNFQHLLRDYPAETLNEIIPNFHNTPDRLRLFKEAVAADVCARRSEVEAEIAFVLEREEFAQTLERAHREGRLPLKVTHNDTKLNNILFDKYTDAPLCVIDLDTIMPGYSVNDFGDSIRFGATTALEDEVDLSKVNFDINLFELYVKGFIEGAKGGLSEGELEMLPIGAIMMTYECGTRFLTDYLQGDTYFRTSRKNHNLDRARNQFKLVRDMEANLPKMREIVKKYSHN